jgi:hypothetical protein
MGWGGSGDAWYALPYLDTKATEGGSNYLSEVVDGIVTMLGYDTDDIVPVVGQVNMAGVSIKMPGVTDTNGETRVIAADANGYFATRVPASMSGGTLECMGKTATYTIGEAAAESTDPEELVPALPDWVMPWPLLNATVCFKLEDAIEAALAENKAVLRVSGTGGDEGTQAVLDYIYGLDEENEGDFTNKFVYIYSEAGSTAGDVSPSVGVYLPQEMDAADRWLASNGMLTYDWNVDSEDRVQTVLDVGWDLYQRRSGNTKLTIVTPTFEEGTPLFTITYEGATNTVKETPAAGEYVNAFTDGQSVTVKSLSELTNETAGVVLACSGWTLTNETTGAVQKGSGKTATFTVATNETVSLLWSVKTNAVYVTVKVYNINGGGKNNKVEPGSGWYPYGTTATFTAEPDVDGGFVFENWCGGDGRKEIGLVEGVSAAGLMLVSDCLAPVSVQANFRRGSGSAYAPAETNTVTVVSYAIEMDDEEEDEGVVFLTPFEDVATVPATKVVAVPGQDISLADGESAAVPAITVGFSIPSPVVDETGGVWRCVSWYVEETGERGSGSGAGIKASEDLTLVWIWELEVEEEDPNEDVPEEELIPVPPDGEQLLTIYPNDDGTLTVEAKVANGYKGYYYSLYAANDLSGPWATVEKAQSGYKGTGLVQASADGEVDLAITFDPAEVKKFYKVVVDKENPAN